MELKEYIVREGEKNTIFFHNGDCKLAKETYKISNDMLRYVIPTPIYIPKTGECLLSVFSTNTDVLQLSYIRPHDSDDQITVLYQIKPKNKDDISKIRIESVCEFLENLCNCYVTFDFRPSSESNITYLLRIKFKRITIDQENITCINNSNDTTEKNRSSCDFKWVLFLILLLYSFCSCLFLI